MESLILKTGARAASAFVLLSLSDSSTVARRRLWLAPETLMAIGILLAAVSALPAWLKGETIFTGLWLPTFSLPLLGAVHLGTPLIFDLGVVLAVIGFTLTVIFSLEESE